MKSLIRAVLGAKTPGMSRAERKFRSQFDVKVFEYTTENSKSYRAQISRNGGFIDSVSASTMTELMDKAKQVITARWYRNGANKPKETGIKGHKL